MADLTNFDGSLSFDMNFDDPAQMARMLNLIQGVDSKIEKPKKSKEWMRQNGFYRSKGEFGIKVLDDDRFAVLYIPKGATVHVDFAPSDQLGFMHGYGAKSTYRFEPEQKDLRKHRVDEAYVVAMCKLAYEQRNGKVDHGWIEPYVYCDEKLSLETVCDGVSCKNKSFEYHTGAKLVIGTYDYDHDEACSEGIHFFTNAKRALDYGYDDVIWGVIRRSRSNCPKNLMFTMRGAELLEPWMEEQIERFKTGWGKDIYEAESYEQDEDDDEEKSDRISVNELYETADDAHAAIEKLVEAVRAIKPAERTDLGRYSYRHPARGTRCNCDAGDDSGDRPP